MIMNKEQVKKLLNENRQIDGNCWRYTGRPASNGYGRIMINYRSYFIHRISAWAYLGLDLDDKKILSLHKQECPNRDCFNPEHLYIGDKKDNAQDSIACGTHNRTREITCERGHIYAETGFYTVKTRNGGSRRECKVCIKLRAADRKVRKQEEERYKLYLELKADTN